MSQPNHNDWNHAVTHGGAHLVKHALESEPGKQAVRTAVGAAATAVAAVPLLLPLAALGGIAAAIWWWTRE